MLFNSWTYLFFLFLSCIVYFILKKPNFRVYFICLASVVFYSFWRWEYSLLMIFSAVIDYFCSIRITKIREKNLQNNAKVYLYISLFINLGLLIFFKYSYFLYDNIYSLASLFGVENMARKLPFEIILPMGISFYTFQTISYTIDIYRQTYPAEKNFFYFMAYVTFWPQLVAGPILRADEIIGQFYVKHKFVIGNLIEGGKRILFGLFKKVVIADNIANSVDHIYSLNPTTMTVWDVIIAACLFGFQIYFDFSGYSDIALGSAKIMGFNLPENFNWPYMAKSPREFWKNWHISLSSWIRDYLYIPLTGQKFKVQHGTEGGLGDVVVNEDISKKKISKTKGNIALFLTWFIMGLWHGAGWNFAMWGVYHAFFIFIFRIINTRHLEIKFPILATIITFFISMMGWVPFRADSLEATLAMYSRFFHVGAYNPIWHKVSFLDYGLTFLIIAGMVITHLFTFKYTKFSSNPIIRVVIYSLMIASVLVYLQANDQFIYFQF
jgi:alginate O-acetyltransferase complex protein AlgI